MGVTRLLDSHKQPVLAPRPPKAVAGGAACHSKAACRKGAYGVAPPFSGGRLAPPRSVLM